MKPILLRVPEIEECSCKGCDLLWRKKPCSSVVSCGDSIFKKLDSIIYDGDDMYMRVESSEPACVNCYFLPENKVCQKVMGAGYFCGSDGIFKKLREVKQ